MLAENQTGGIVPGPVRSLPTIATFDETRAD